MSVPAHLADASKTLTVSADGARQLSRIAERVLRLCHELDDPSHQHAADYAQVLAEFSDILQLLHRSHIRFISEIDQHEASLSQLVAKYRGHQ